MRSRRRAGSSEGGPRGQGGCSGSPRARSRAPSRSRRRRRPSAPSCTSPRAGIGAGASGRAPTAAPRRAPDRAGGRTTARAAARSRRRRRSRPHAASSRAPAARSASPPRSARRRPVGRTAPRRGPRAPRAALPRRIERRVQLALDRAELLPCRVVGQHGEARLGRAQRQLLAAEDEPRREDRVLELVLPLGERGVDDASLARLPQAVEALALLGRRRILLGAERLELLAREEVGVAGDDRGLLGGLLLADPDGAVLLRRLDVVGAIRGLVLLGPADGGRAHRCTRSPVRPRTVRTSASGSKGFGRTASAAGACSKIASGEPVTRTTGTDGSCAWHSSTRSPLVSSPRCTSRSTTSNRSS